MSVKVMGWIWDMELPQDEKLIALAYADHAHHDGTNVFPAVIHIAKKTGYSKRSVQRITRKLEHRGLLIDDGQSPSGTRQWRMPVPQNMGVTTWHPPTSEAEGDDTGVRGGMTSTTSRDDIAVSSKPSLSNHQGNRQRNWRRHPQRRTKHDSKDPFWT
jgi:hypothetical protein